MADPPWEYDDKCSGNRGVIYKYPTLNPEEIIGLGSLVEKITAPNAALFLWATPPQLPVAMLALEVWGFEYKTIAFTWIKTNKKSFTFHWGMGNWTRANPEHVLLGIKGKPKRIHKGVHSTIIRPIMEHSRKPPEVRHQIVKLMGDVPRIELFATDRVAGWHAVGGELDGMDIREALKRQARR